MAADPVDQAIVFELMMRLFFTRVLGIRKELIGWRRGNVMKLGKMWNGNGIAADFTTSWLFGPIAAAFGLIEAQGRGSLHPHILIWLLLSELSDLLVWMLRDRSNFRHRLNMWMRELVASVASVQESAVTQLPQILQPGNPSPDAALVPPLPFGVNDRRRYHADGAVETATPAELGVEAQGDDKDTSNADGQGMYYYVPANTETDAWQPAVRPDLPLRSNAGDEVTEEQWNAEHNESDVSLWTKKISEWASGKFPAYRMGECTVIERFPEEARLQMKTLRPTCAKRCLRKILFARCVMMLGTWSSVARCTFAARLASSTTRQESPKSVDIIFTTSLVSRRRIT